LVRFYVIINSKKKEKKANNNKPLPPKKTPKNNRNNKKRHPVFKVLTELSEILRLCQNVMFGFYICSVLDNNL
jgi:hypothetical protein